MNSVSNVSKVSKILKVVLFSILLAIFVLSFSAQGEASETWEIVSADFKSAVENFENAESVTKSGIESEPENKSEMVEIEYGGKLISVDIMDLILMADGSGGQEIGLGNPEKYADQLENAPLYGVRKSGTEGLDAGNPVTNAQQITEREYEE